MIAEHPVKVQEIIRTVHFIRFSDGTWMSESNDNVDFRPEAKAWFCAEYGIRVAELVFPRWEYEVVTFRENEAVQRIRTRVKNLLTWASELAEKIREGDEFACEERDEYRDEIGTHRNYLRNNQLADEWLADQRDEYVKVEQDEITTKEAFKMIWPHLHFEDCIATLHEFKACDIDKEHEEAIREERRESVA